MSAKDRAIKKQLRQTQAIQAMHFGANEERERIIKLVEERQPVCNIDFYNGNGCDCTIPYHDLMDLIQGHNK